IKYFDIELFVSILTKKEYLQLTAGENVAEFIKIWTMKEAILKADGRGLFADINQIIIDNNTAYFDNIIWYIKSCTIDKQYQISIASKTKIEVCYKEIKFKEIASIYNSLQSTLGNRNRLH
ncbi:MAG TPA: 4'-phosphopantetheinyl transferase superfamily protein, partial [Candidatus Paceibacterota bacterium]